MPLKYKHRLLLVDDEESITKALYRIFRKEGYEIHTALSGQEGLKALKEASKPFSLIISDQRMPGMTGAQFLEKAKRILPGVIRILLTGYSDMDAIVDAINKGEIHRYLTKPWKDDDLLIQIRQALEQYELRVENKRLLALTRRKNIELRELSEHLEEKVTERSREIIEKNKELARLNKELESSLYNTVRAFASLMEGHDPLLIGHGRRVSMFSREIAQLLDMPENEVIQIEIAAILHDIGKLGFPQILLGYKEDKWGRQEKELFCRHPKLGQETVQFINQLDHVGILIGCHHEQYDGHGYPDQLSEEEIPLGSKIIAVADSYDKIVNLKIDGDRSTKETIREIKKTQGHLTEDEVLQKAAIRHLKNYAFKRYDPDVIKVFLNLLNTGKSLYKKEKQLSIEDLKKGMVLSRPIYYSQGRLLLPHNTTLTENHISTLKVIDQNYPIDNKIYVLRQGKQITNEES